MRSRVALLTGDGLRHRAVASRLGARLDLAGVVSEAKAPAVVSKTPLGREDSETIERHFRERDEVERALLGEEVRFPAVERLDIPQGQVNAEQTAAWVRALRPDLLVLYGTGIVRAPLLEEFEGRIVNIHLGLSPYYRGAGTNFWPLVERRPECVGATIHLAVAKVDAGPILGQVRPVAAPADRAHHLGTRTILAAVEALPLLVARYLRGRLDPQRQDLSRGRVFRRKDFHAEAVRTMWRQFETGMMDEYLKEAEARQAAFPIVPA